MPGLRFWPRGLQEFLAGLWGASSCKSCSSASSSCQIREACDVETCVSTWRTQRATPLAIPRGRRLPASPAPCPASPPPHAARSRPPPRFFRGLWCVGHSRSPVGGSAGGSTGSSQAGSSWGCGVGSRILTEPMLWHWWVQVMRQAGSSQSQPSFCDPNRIFQMTANPEPVGGGRSRRCGHSTASHRSASAGGDAPTANRSHTSRRIIHRQPITAQPFTVPVIMWGSQSGCRFPADTQCLGGCG